MTIQDAIITLDEVIPSPDNKMVDGEHKEIAIAWKTIRDTLLLQQRKTTGRLTARTEEGLPYFPECFKDPCFGGGCGDTDCDFMTEVCKALAQYEEAEDGWISARDRVPEDQEEVLVCTRSKNGCRNIDKGYWSIDRFVHRGTAEVTHWMPLPVKPKEEIR